MPRRALPVPSQPHHAQPCLPCQTLPCRNLPIRAGPSRASPALLNGGVFRLMVLGELVDGSDDVLELGKMAILCRPVFDLVDRLS